MHPKCPVILSDLRFETIMLKPQIQEIKNFASELSG